MNKEYKPITNFVMSGQILFLCSGIMVPIKSALCKRAHILQAIMPLHENRVRTSETIINQLLVDPVILVNGCIVVFILFDIQVMKHMIKSLPLIGQHLASIAIKELNDQIIITVF